MNSDDFGARASSYNKSAFIHQEPVRVWPKLCSRIVIVGLVLQQSVASLESESTMTITMQVALKVVAY